MEVHNNILNQQLQSLISSPAISANAISGFTPTANATTRGVDVAFTVVAVTGIRSITLFRNYLDDIKTATVLQTWNPFVADYTWSDTDSALQSAGAAYYWLALSPTGTTGKTTTIGPQQIVLNPQLTPPTVATAISASHGAASNGYITVTINVNGMPATGSIKIYVTGYQGNSNPVAVAQSTSSPLQFTMQATGETVTFKAIGVSAGGVEASTGPTTTLTLNGTATVPATPQGVTIAQIPSGNQISFPASKDTVTSYQIWRANQGDPFSSATLLTTITPTGSSIYDYLDTGGFSGKYEYFLVAVNAVGSSLPSSPATVNFIAASSVLYVDGQAVQALQPAAPNADVTAQQPIVYTGLSSNLVPNGTFILGNILGWAINSASYNSGGLLMGYNIGGCYSPAFNVTPGQKYRLSFTARQTIGGTPPQNVYLRIIYGATYSPNITGATYTDLMASGSLTSSFVDYTYDWTCPAGMNYASLAMFQLAAGAAQLLFTIVSAQAFVVGVGNLGVNGSGGLSGASGAAIDSGGNIVLKNIGTVQGTTGTLTSTFASLPNLGTMSYSLKGNPVLVALSLYFQATSSGGNITNCGFSPSTASGTGGPPSVSISISGDGSGSTATVTWATTGGPSFTFTPTVNLAGGAGYSYANAIVTVTVPPGTSYSGPGSGTYGCTVATATPQAGVSLSTQVLIDGAILIDPTQGYTDGNGRAKFNEVQVFSIAAGSHTFAVQAKYDGSTAAKFISGMFNVVELG